jgi:hypothetical protein
MPTVLTIVQELTDKFPTIGRPSTLVNSSNKTVKQFLALLNEEGRSLVKQSTWPELRKEYSLTLVSGQETYALPSDFSAITSDTIWDRTNSRQVVGGLTPKEWQIQKSAVGTSEFYKNFTIKGTATNQIFVYPTPASTDDGAVIIFEYFSKSWLRPAIWTTSTTYAANDYTWYNGNYYTTTSGGTSGATAPTHTSGSVSDGGVTWTYTSATYDSVLKDTDVSFFDSELIGLGVLWRFMRINGLPNFEDYRAEYNGILEERKGALISARTVSLAGRPNYKFINNLNLPDTITGA